MFNTLFGFNFSTGKIIASIVSILILNSLFDWFFSGYLFHERYQKLKIWRKWENHNTPIILGAILNIISSIFIVFLFFLIKPALLNTKISIIVSVFISLALILPIILTYGTFIEMHPKNIIAHCLNWVFKILITFIILSLNFL